MGQTVKLRRSAVAGKKPINSQLELGELSLNTTDGKLFFAKSGSQGPTVEEIITTNAQNTGSLEIIGSITGSNFTGSFVGDASGLYNIPVSGVTGLSLDKIENGLGTASIDSDGLQVNVRTSITGSLTATEFTGSGLGLTNVPVNISGSSDLGTIYNRQYTKFHFDEASGIKVEGDSTTGVAKIYLSGVAAEGSQTEGRTALLEVTSASSTWTLTHNLGERYPAITVFDSDGNVIIPQNIEAVTANQLIVSFASPQTGTVSATVGGGLPTISGSYGGRVLTVNSDGTRAEWKEGILSSSISFNTYTSSIDGVISSIENTTSSFDGRLDLLELESGSIRTIFNSYTASNTLVNSRQDDRLNAIEIFTGSIDNTYATDADVTALRGTLNSYTSSNNVTNSTQNGRLSSLESESGSIRSTFNSYTSSNNSTNNTQNSRLSSLETKSGSLEGRVGSLETISSSHDGRLDSLETTSGSHNSRINTLESFKTSVDGGLEFTGSNVTIKGNLLVKGTETRVNSTTVDLSDNIISLNGSAASNGGIEVRDNTSPGLLSGSLLWDGTNNYWVGGTKGNEERLLLDSDLTLLDGRLDSIESKTGSFLTSANLSTLEGKVSSLEVESGSIRSTLNSYTTSNDNLNSTQNGRLSSLETESGSIRSTFNTYTSSNNNTNTTQNSRLTLLETSTGSLNLFTGSINTTIKSKINSDNVHSGSYLGTSTTSNLPEGSNLYYTDNRVKGKLNSERVISGSIQVDITSTTNYNLVDGRLDSIESFTASLDNTYATDADVTGLRNDLNSYTSSTDNRIDSIESKTGSFLTTETQTLQDVTDLGSTTSNSITAAGLNTTTTISVSGTNVVDSNRRIYGTGTASNTTPAFTFAGDTDTGLSRIGADSVGLIAGASRKFYVSGTNAFFQNLTGGLQLSDVPLTVNSDATITGSTLAGSFRKIGGVSTEFLKADGSVDTNTYLTSHPVVSAATSSNNSGRTYIQDILLDQFGHITGITTGTETVVDTNNYTTGVTFNTADGVLTFTRNGSETYTVDLDGRYSLTSHTHDDRYYTETEIERFLDGTTPINGYNKDNWDAAYGWGDHSTFGYLTSYVNNFTTGATFNTTSGVITFTRNNGDTFTVDIDGKYSELGHNHDDRYYTESESDSRFVNSAGDTMTGDLVLRNDTAGDNTIIRDITWNSTAAEGTDDRLAVIRVYTSAGSTTTRGGQLNFYTRQSNSPNFNTMIFDRSGNLYVPTNVYSNSQQLATQTWVTGQNYLTAHPSVSAASSSNNSGRTYIQDILLDSFGHITGITTATETVVNTDTNYYTTGTTWNGTTATLTFTRNDGGTYNVQMLETLSDVTVTGGTYNSGTQTLRLVKSDGSTVDVSGFAVDTDVNWYTTGATFNTSNGIITGTRNDGGTWTVDIDGKYLNLSGGTLYNQTNTTGTSGTSFLTIHNNVGGDLSQQQSFIDFMFTDSNANFFPQVRIGAQVGRDADADAISKEGAGAFVVYTGNGTDEIGGGALTEAMRVSYNGSMTVQNTITATGGNSTQWNAAYGWGDHGTRGYLTAHPSVSAASSSNNSGRTYIQDILLDSFGHITGITTGTETVVNTDTNYYVTGATFNTGDGVITFTRNDGSTVTVDIDGRFTDNDYADAMNQHVRTSDSPTFVSTTLTSTLTAPTIQIGNASFSRSGDQNHVHFVGTALIPNTTTTSSNSSMGNSSYRWSTVYGGYGNFSNSVTANAFAKIGGTSSQFLMADGSVSTNPGWLTSHPSVSAASSSNNSGRTYIQDILLDSFGHITGITTATETVVDTDTITRVGTAGNEITGTVTLAGSGATSVNQVGNTVTISSTNTTYTAGGGLTLSGTQFSHADTSATSSSNNSGRTYIQDILLDTYGHITGITTATETVVNTDTNYYTTGATWTAGTATLTFTRNDGGTYNVQMLETLTDVTVTGGTYNSGTQTLRLTKSDGSTVDVSGFAVDTDVNWYTTGATFNTSNGVITGTRNDGGTWTVDIDGKYLDATSAAIHNQLYVTGGDADTYTRFGIYRNYAVNGPIAGHNTILNVAQYDGNYGFQLGADTTSTADGLYYRSKDTTIGTWKQVASRSWVTSQNYLTQHPTISAASSSNNSGRTYIQDILLDTYGHITGITTATETVVNTDTNYYTTGATFNTGDGVVTFTRNNGGTYTVDLDGRYLQSESDTLSSVTTRGNSTTNDVTVGDFFAVHQSADNATTKVEMLSMAVAKFKPHSTNSGTLAVAQVDSGNSVGLQYTNGAGTADWDIVLQPFGGNVGINKINPQGAFHVYSGTSERFLISGDVHVQGTTDLNINGDSRRMSFTAGTGTIRTTTANALYLQTNSTTAITIDSSQNVSITGTLSASGYNKTNWDTAYTYSTVGHLPLAGGTLTGNLVLNSVNPEIQFNGTSDPGVDMAIKATPEGLDFYEPEDGSKIHFQILDDIGVNAAFGLQVGGTSVISSSRVLQNVSGNISMFSNDSGYLTTYTDTNYYTTGATFNTSNGIITGTRNDGGTWTVDIDGRYAYTSHTHDDRYFTETESDARYPLSRGSIGTSSTPGDTTGFGNNLAAGTYTRNYTGHSGQMIMSHDTGGSVGNVGIEVTYSGDMWVHTNIDSSSWGTKTIWTSRNFTSSDISNWNTAYGWGNHASAGYVTHDYYTTGTTFNSSTGILTFTRNDGGTYTANLLSTLSDVTVTGGTYNSGTQTLRLTKSDGSTVDVSGFAVDTDVNWYTTSASFNATNGIITGTRNDGGTWTADLGNVVYGNAKGTNDSVTTDNDGLDKTGYYTSGGFTTRPSGVANWMYIEHIKLYNSNTAYQKQIGYDTYDNRMWVRTKNNGTWSGWKQIWTSDVFSNNSSNWDTAYGWGNHASAGYLTSYVETDTLATVVGRGSTASSITLSGTMRVDGDIRGGGQQLVLNAGEAYTYATGQTSEYIYLNAEQGLEINSETGNWSGGWAARKTAYLRGDQLTLDGETLTKTNIQNFKTAYGWGNHASAGYLTSFDITTQTDAKYLRSDADDTFTGNLTSANSGWIRYTANNNTDSNDGKIGAGVFGSGLNIVGSQTTAGTGRQVRIWGSVITDTGETYWHSGNDGAGSGLDADNLDGSTWESTNKKVRWDSSIGYHGNPRSMAIGYSGGNYGQFGYGLDFTSTSNVHTYAINDIVTRVDMFGGLIVFAAAAGTVGTNITWTETFRARYNESAPTFKGNTIWHAGNDGSGSGLDADTVDGIQASSFIRSDADDTTTGIITLAKGSTGTLMGRTGFADAVGYNASYGMYIGGGASNATRYLYAGGYFYDGSTTQTLWHTGNDGASSGLDADLLDGQHGSYYQAASTAINTGNIGSQSVAFASEAQLINFPDGPRNLSDRNPNWNNRSVSWDFVTAATVGGAGNYAGVMTFSPWDGTTSSTGDSSYQLAFYNVSGVNASGIPGMRLRNGIDTTWKTWYTVWHSGNDGSGSGLDADTVDGIQGSSIITTSNIASQSVSYANSAGNADTVDNLHATSFMRTDAQSTTSGHLIIESNWSNGSTYSDQLTIKGTYPSMSFRSTNADSNVGGTWLIHMDSSGDLQYYSSTDGPTENWTKRMSLFQNGTLQLNGSTVWHTGNDGSGSGLDADLLDGQQGSYYTNAGNLTGTIGDVFTPGTRYNIGLIDGNGSQTRDKIRVWDGSEYTIGMKSGYTYGWLGKGTDGYAMSFQMSNTQGRGFWWGDTGHNDSQGAMSLTTDGKATIATSLTVGEGESITAPSSTTLYVKGNTQYATVFDVQGTQGQLFSITDDLTGDIFKVSDISGIPILNVNSNGTVTIDETLNVYGDVTAYYSSDERLKDNVIPITNAIDKMKLIGGYEFDWNENSKHVGHDVGVIAQEIEKVLPEVVTTRSNGYKAVKYEKLTALLIQANKELIQKVEELERKLK